MKQGMNSSEAESISPKMQNGQLVNLKYQNRCFTLSSALYFYLKTAFILPCDRDHDLLTILKKKIKKKNSPPQNLALLSSIPTVIPHISN